jgi:SNF2 family DNA or RNA helicase
MQNGEAVLPPRATLIIMPAYLIEQWVDSITRFSDDFRVLVYHGSAKGSNVHKAQLQADTLCRADLLNGHEDWARTLIVTSYQTMTARHGRKSIKQSIKVLLQTQRPDLTSVERNKEAERMLQDADSTSPLPLLPQNLRQCFERVILDEAHEVRNQETQNSWTIQNLRAQNNILLTATPFINTVEDIAGLVKILRPDEDELWRKENLKKLGVILTDDTGQEQETIDPDCFNPWTLDDPSEPGYDLRWTSISLRHHIFSQKSTLAEKGAVMRPIFKEFILKRGYPSKVDGKRIGDELPPVQNITVYLKFTQLEQDYYQPIFEKYLKKLFRKRGESIVYDTNSFRLLTLLTSWLGFERLASTYKVKMLKDFGRRGGNAMTILADLLSAEKKAGIPPTEQTSMPHPNDIQGILAVFARGSPKLRYLLLTIAELVILKAEKMLIFVGLPAQQTWLECVSYPTIRFVTKGC